MSVYTIVRMPWAIALGLLFAGIAGWTLLWEVHGFADITLDHVQTLGALIGVIAAGHFAVLALRHRLYVWATILGVAWCAGTCIIITGSAGRVAETAVRKVAEADRSNDVRKDALEELAKARAKRDALGDQFVRECSSGRAGKCNGLKFALDAADSHVAILLVRAEAAAPEQIANVRIKYIARFLAFFLNYDQHRAEIGLELLSPVTLPLLNELLAIGFFGMGLGHGKLKVPRLPRLRISKRRKFAPRIGNPLAIRKSTTTIADAEIVMAALARAAKPVSNEELASLMGCSPGEACKRVAGLNGKLRKQRSGRYVLISPAH